MAGHPTLPRALRTNDFHGNHIILLLHDVKSDIRGNFIYGGSTWQLLS